jgi:hypothetical protein
MEKLNKIEGKFYTQNVDELPIEERVFFREGLVVNVDDFRIATEDEVNAWEEYKRKQDEEFNQIQEEL